MVHNLSSVVRSNLSIFVDWEAPFSLVLTPTDTDTEIDIITYCVAVYTHSTQELLGAECGLMETNYTHTHTRDLKTLLPAILWMSTSYQSAL